MSDRIKNDPCWKGYKMVGKKTKDGKEVPNCVKDESVDESVNEGQVEKEVLQKISKFESLLGYITNDDQYKPLVSKVKKEIDKLKKQIKKNESVNEAYIVTYAKKKGEKPASAAFSLRGSALSFERDLKKDGYITMVTQKKVKGVDESVNEVKASDIEIGDFVHLKSKNQSGMVLNVSGGKVTIRTPKGKVTSKLSDVMLLHQDNVNESLNESQWVAYVEDTKGRKKLLKTLKSHRAAVMWNNKNIDQVLSQSGVQGAGIMKKDNWDRNEAPYAVESLNAESKSVVPKVVGRDTGVKLNIKSIKKHLERNGYKVDYAKGSSMVNPKYIDAFNPTSGNSITIGRNGELFGDGNWGAEVKSEKEFIKALKQYEKELGESVNEAVSRTAMEIGGLTGMNKDVIQKFVDDNNLDIEKVYQFVKNGKFADRMKLVSAIAGKPNNPVQKKMVKQFSESLIKEAKVRLGKDSVNFKVMGDRNGLTLIAASGNDLDGLQDAIANDVDVKGELRNTLEKQLKVPVEIDQSYSGAGFRFNIDFYSLAKKVK